MSQGHALSVLTRAYRKMNDEKYLHAAINGLQLFKKPLYEENDRNSDMNSEHLNKKQTGFKELFSDYRYFYTRFYTINLLLIKELWQSSKCQNLALVNRRL